MPHTFKHSVVDRLTTFGKAILIDRYLLKGETFDGLYERVAKAYADNDEHAERLYDYMAQLWLVPSTPILSNGGTTRGLPISCFLNECNDSLKSISDMWTENVWLASRGGGIGSYWGNVRSIGEKLSNNGSTCGIIPFLKVMDSMTLAISQGSLRRGSAAVYLPIDHPEIEEFVEIRKPTGDHNRRSLNLHHGVCVTDKFMVAVRNNEKWDLISPHTKKVLRQVDARDLWIKILTSRVETGEPYIIYTDNINKVIPEHHKKLGLTVKMSNLCTEITLPTGLDHLGKTRTAVCCISSLNLEYFDEWKDNEIFILDVMRFLDNVLQDFIDRAPDDMERARYSAMRERSVALSVLGLHARWQSKMIPFASAAAQADNKRIFKHIHKYAMEASKILAEERGACPDAEECNVMERFSNKISIAPTASVSVIAGESSPSIEPYSANVYLQKTLSGSHAVINKHLRELLIVKGVYSNELISDIANHMGSVQHLSCLTDEEKEVFKTAFEIDQRWIIQHAADRTPYICQSQSVNVFLPADVGKLELHKIHFSAWEKGIKSLYYCRSKAISRAEKIPMSRPTKAEPSSVETQDGDECLACQ